MYVYKYISKTYHLFPERHRPNLLKNKQYLSSLIIGINVKSWSSLVHFFFSFTLLSIFKDLWCFFIFIFLLYTTLLFEFVSAYIACLELVVL
jgi:hypothetical protein